MSGGEKGGRGKEEGKNEGEVHIVVKWREERRGRGHE